MTDLAVDMATIKVMVGHLGVVEKDHEDRIRDLEKANMKLAIYVGAICTGGSFVVNFGVTLLMKILGSKGLL